MYPVEGLVEEPEGQREDEAHVAWVVEALARHAVHALLRHQPLDELQVRREVREPLHVNLGQTELDFCFHRNWSVAAYSRNYWYYLDHHVHGPARHDGDEAGRVAQLGEGQVRVLLDHVDGVLEE